jgi:hypothetical protein
MIHFTKKVFVLGRHITKIPRVKSNKMMKSQPKKDNKIVKKSWIPGDEFKIKLTWGIKKI